MMEMKEHPIIFNTDMVKAILDGRKTQTRRTRGLDKVNAYFDNWQFVDLKTDLGYRASEGYLWAGFQRNTSLSTIYFKCPYGQVGDRLWCRQNYFVLDEYLLGKSDILYRLTDDRICAILTMEVQDERYKTDEWSPSQAYPSLPQRGLHGGVGWSNLLTNKIQRLWAEGIRGLVSAKRASDWQGIYGDKYESSESQSHKEYSPTDMYGFSWDATLPVISDQTFRRKWSEQLAEQFTLGHSGGELAGQEGTRTRKRRGKTSNGEANRLPDEGSQVGNRIRASESAQGSEDTWDVAGWHLRSCPPRVLRLRPSIFMPRWASRITLEITDIRVERVQDISRGDALAEGIIPLGGLMDSEPWCASLKDQEPMKHPEAAFGRLWDSINAKRGYGWEVNPWVWVISFKVVNK